MRSPRSPVLHANEKQNTPTKVAQIPAAVGKVFQIPVAAKKVSQIPDAAKKVGQIPVVDCALKLAQTFSPAQRVVQNPDAYDCLPIGRMSSQLGGSVGSSGICLEFGFLSNRRASLPHVFRPSPIVLSDFTSSNKWPRDTTAAPGVLGCCATSSFAARRALLSRSCCCCYKRRNSSPDIVSAACSCVADDCRT